jgi:hypothetical protein
MSDNKPVITKPGDYPGLSGEAARALKKALKSTGAGLAATKTLADNVGSMREAVIALLPNLEAAGTDAAKVYAAAHEIRGLAGNAELKSAARIAGVLCLYLDGIMRAGRQAEAALVRLHVAAIGRAARAIDEDSRFSLHVAKELAMLVNTKLAEIP